MPICGLERCSVFLCWLRGARYNDCETKADFSWIQRSGDHIWFVTSTICIKGQINVYFEGLVVWFIYRRFWSWRNLQQMNTAQKAVTRTLWKPLIKICSIWYIICPLKSQFKRDLATEFFKDCLEEYIRRYKFMINKILLIMDPCNLVFCFNTYSYWYSLSLPLKVYIL